MGHDLTEHSTSTAGWTLASWARRLQAIWPRSGGQGGPDRTRMDQYAEISQPRVIIINPVGSGLFHYTRSLVHVLAISGARVTVFAINEPSASGRGRLRWVWDYCQMLLRVHKSSRGARIIITWPVLGYWDFVIIRLLLGGTKTQVVIHDPEPLVRAKGYGQIARRIASLPIVRTKPLVHSKVAADVVLRQTAGLELTVLPHPMLKPSTPSAKGEQPLIRVLGQYKADRDVASLRQLTENRHHNWRYQIIGRGWKPVPGWEVSDRYVSESEFDSLITESSVVLVPYLRFFQSGVAIRCLERGTPVVGSRTSSLANLLGAENSWLVGDEPWKRAVEAAIQTNSAETFRVAMSAYSQVLEQWRVWFAATQLAGCEP
jgi:hypothetical protein